MPAALEKSLNRKAGKTVAVVENIWNKAQAIAVKEGRKEDYPYITDILKRMLRIETENKTENKTDSNTDSSLLLEAWGPEVTAKLLTEAMPASTNANLSMRWLEIEKQIRNIPSGTVSWPTLARALRQGVYALLNWASQDRPEERYRKFVGIV